MRSFALMAILAAYASAVEIKDVGDLTAGADEEIQAAVDAITADVDGANDAHADGGKNEHNQAIADSIDGTLGKIDGLGAPKPPQPERHPEPDNYRPPPVQNHKRRERRERPNIHDHGLLKSMNLNYVNSGWQ